ncbi:hypothetical protein [Corynebacterium sp. 335C]
MENLTGGETLHLSPAALRALAGDLEARARAVDHALSRAAPPAGMPGSRAAAAAHRLLTAWRVELGREAGRLDRLGGVARRIAASVEEADRGVAGALRCGPAPEGARP